MNVYDLLVSDTETVALAHVFLDEDNKQKVQQFIREHFYLTELSRYGLPVDNKILLHGASGCGKTMTAKAIAQALGKKLLLVNLSSIIGPRIGETAQHLKLVFDKAGREQAVLFLDEFDHLGKARDNDSREVGEIRRLVNALIQLIDYYPENAVLVAATNHPGMIDTALLRRFQQRVAYVLPDREALDRYYDKLLSGLPVSGASIVRKYELSFAEARDYAFGLAKRALIDTWGQKHESLHL